jgi:hypothetical protein
VFLSDGRRNLQPSVPSKEVSAERPVLIPVKLALTARDDFDAGYDHSNVKAYMESHPMREAEAFEDSVRLPIGSPTPTPQYSDDIGAQEDATAQR